ncbi:MAG: hypothetical protein RJA70_290 [Pseudomonadota bacterium]|jgi:AAA family ATP:ADP antiporter
MLESVKHKWLRLAALSDGEFRRAWPIGGAYACILASLYMLKPARSSLFLTVLGIDVLPYALLLTAAFGAGAALTLSKLTRRVPLARLALWVLPILGLCLVGFRVLLASPNGPLTLAFYVWVNLYGHLATALIWLLANAVFDAREARRVFGFVGAMGILGAVFGGGLTQLFSAQVGTLNLLWIPVALQAAAFWLIRSWQHRSSTPLPQRRRRHAQSALDGSAFRDLREHGLLRMLALLSFCAAVVSTVVDVQFNILVDQSFATQDAKTAFFGLFFALLNMGAFLFQLIVTPRLLARFGLAQVLWLLPAALALGSAALLFVPMLAGALWLKASDVGFRHSAYKSALEMLFVPLRLEVKQRARVLIDATVDNVGTGVGALLVLLLLNTAGLHFQWLGVLILLGGGVWVIGIWRAREAYVAAFRQGLAKREIRPEDLAVQLTDPLQRSPLIAALSSSNPRQVRYALEMLAGVRDPSLIVPLLALLTHEDATLRSRALNALGRQRGGFPIGPVSACLEDPSPEVRREALWLLAARSVDPHQFIEAALNGDSEQQRLAALGCIALYLGEGGARLLSLEVQERILVIPGETGERVRAELARALGATRNAAPGSVLLRLLREPSGVVVEQALLALGALRDPEQLDGLVARLGERTLRRAASSALQQYGDRAVPRLGELLLDPSVSPQVRAAAARILTQVASPRAALELTACVVKLAPPRRLAPLKALSKLRSSGANLDFSRAQVELALATEAEFATRLRTAAAAGETHLERQLPKAIALSVQALKEKQQASVDRTFRLLALVYPPRDVYTAFLGIQSTDPRRRAQALEFLDNLINHDDRPFVFPFVETGSVRASETEDEAEAASLRILFGCEEPWLRACALFAASTSWVREHQAAWEPLLVDPNPIVRQTADAVLARTLASGPVPAISNESSRNMLSVVEKVIFLQNVDVFSQVPSETLSLLAAVSEEIVLSSNERIYAESDPSDGMYVVVEGLVRLHRAETLVTQTGPGEAFGTWALFDDELRVTAATAQTEVRLLRVDKDDFVDLLAENIELTQAILKAVVGRLRTVVSRVGPTSGS